MLRSLVPSEPELVLLCQQKDWSLVKDRAECHPKEACPSSLALQGHGTTALAIAVRSGAPVQVLESLVKANVHQVGICHQRRGTIIHETLQHRCAPNVLRYLLRTVIHYENVHNRSISDRKRSLLSERDDLGRTALHCLVQHNLQSNLHHMAAESSDSVNWILFRSLVLACPEAVGMMDVDAKTPLMLLVTAPRTNDERVENRLFRMIQLLVVTCPPSVTITRKLNRPWRHPDNTGCPNGKKCLTVGDGAPNPLAFALLYGRRLDIVELLLKANEKVGVKGCLAIVSQYHEVPLHVAVTTRASPLLLCKLLKHGPEAVLVRDRHGLTPLDWLWIRFVVDWCSTQHPLGNVMVSKRRFVPNQSFEWHARVTKLLEQPELLDELGTFVREQLWQRASILVAAAARESTGRHDEWPALHAACSLPCPLAVVRLALQCNPRQISTPDKRKGRLPLHYAAEQCGFQAHVPNGVPFRVKLLTEKSPVAMILSSFPKAAHVVDAQHQLPLHIAIDNAKAVRIKNSSNDEADTVVNSILSTYHDALERRDGKTKLYPFLQAAAGDGAHTSTIYSLLREHPTLVSLGISH